MHLLLAAWSLGGLLTKQLCINTPIARNALCRQCLATQLWLWVAVEKTAATRKANILLAQLSPADAHSACNTFRIQGIATTSSVLGMRSKLWTTGNVGVLLAHLLLSNTPSTRNALSSHCFTTSSMLKIVEVSAATW
eukprot:CAMPEP_0172852756 /NCGR_PEP_ID=MMETSP1075-20121228/54945_1 /TAXON_ID=2916 /ORGANISM="Ceratium fusus, Strain PA161109" /LENGTH=136 /DNA_ID=CAMNT_0013699115 /DNA_START=361 /DNA_END=768 /DNA_ORIENTATION=-